MDAKNEFKKYYEDASRLMFPDIVALIHNPQGIVIFSPDLCILAKQVNSKKPDTWEELWKIEENPDAYYVHLMAGNLRLAKECAKTIQKLPFICFQRGMRNDAVHIVPMDKFLK